MFVEPLELKKPLAMYDQCTYCKQNFYPEPGFYFGAMFISYIIGSFLFLIPGLFVVFYFGWTPNQAMALIIFMGIVLYLPLLRGSRVLWIHFIMKYSPSKEQKAKDAMREAQEDNKEWKPRG